MCHDQTEANLELVLDWMDALRRKDIDSLADRFHPEVIWVDVAGSIACRGRDELLAWLRASPAHPHQVDALELIADEHHVVLGVHDETREELAGVTLHGPSSPSSPSRKGRSCSCATLPAAPRPSPRVAAATTNGADTVASLG